MVKVYHAKPTTPEPSPSIGGGRGYLISPDAQVIRNKLPQKIEQPMGILPQDRERGTYQTTQGSAFNVEINILDSHSQKPVRSVEVKSGLIKGFTDRVGRWGHLLPAGLNPIGIGGSGFVEKGSFAPEAIKFPPVNFNVDLDKDAVFTIYVPQGEVVMGERHELANPNNPHNPQMDIPLFIQDNWQLLALIGTAGITAYYLGSRSNK